MSNKLDDLDKRMLPYADRLILNAGKQGIALRVITTGRTPEVQAAAIANGTSWTKKSMHLPQPPDGKSLAIDVCPVVLLEQKGWAPKDPLWWQLANIGVALGLRSGMDWRRVGLPPVGTVRPKWDPGHFEWWEGIPAIEPLLIS